jgi:hypothetical protein
MLAKLRTRSFLPFLPLAAVLSLPGAASAADDTATLMGHWRVPPFQQQRLRMSDQCQVNAKGETTQIEESEVEVFNCDDPNHAADKQRILDFIHAVNPIYRADGHRQYSETITGLCAAVRASQSATKQDVCNPSQKLRAAPIVGLPVMWNIRKTGDPEWPYAGDSYSPSSGYGAISCFKKPDGNKVLTKGCRRWTVEIPFIGSEPCDCGCSMIVCDNYLWEKK